MRVADTIAERLAQAGIRHAFGIPGGEILTLIDALSGADIEFVTARHETAAGLMAQGSWVGGGAPGLLVVTVGPGVSNAVNAVANAYLDRVPMIVISAAPEQPWPGGYTHQVFDQLALLRPVVKASWTVTPENIGHVCDRALSVACAHPRGPVHIELTASIAETAVCIETPATDDSLPIGAGELDGQWRQAATCLARARRPLIIAGLETIDSEVAAALGAFTRLTGFPLLTTYKGKGVVDERHPACVGAIALSPKADALAAPLLKAADVVLLVGYDPVEMRAAYVRPFAAETKVLELTPVRREHGMHHAQLEIVADLAQSISALTGALRGFQRHQVWPDELPARVRMALRASFGAEQRPGFSPLAIADVLSRTLPDDAYLTIDTGAHRIALSQAVCARWPGQLQQSNGLCTMGFALPFAIGLARSSRRRVVAAMGDGGFEMVAGELATLRDSELPVTCVVFDDSSLALIDIKQHAAGLARRGVWLGATDHVAVARAFGGRGSRVRDVAGLEHALVDALAQPGGFSLISCALERGAYSDLL